MNIELGCWQKVWKVEVVGGAGGLSDCQSIASLATTLVVVYVIMVPSYFVKSA